MPKRTCSIDGCERPHEARGWCNRHYEKWRAHGDPLAIRRGEGSADHRFWKRVEIQPNGCWYWIGAANTQGYGRFWDGYKRWLAHRWAYEQKYGPVPDGLHLDHFKCDTPKCCNPEHVRPVTPRENTLRADNPASRNLAKTRCIRGHVFDEANTIITPTGRKCRTCAETRSGAMRSVMRGVRWSAAPRATKSGRRREVIHVVVEGVAGCCQTALDLSQSIPAADVPAELRCGRAGCKVRWPKEAA